MIYLLPIFSIFLYFASFFFRYAVIAAISLQLIYLAIRTSNSGHLPLIGPHDTLLFISFSTGATAALSLFLKNVANLRSVYLPISILAALFGYAATLFKPHNFPLPMILDTVWFETHVILAFFGYSLFSVAAILGIKNLFSPDKKIMELLYKTSLAGWLLFSFSMISGGIWGYYAWGTYWLWTPKELWSSVLWLWYAMLIHFRYKGAASDKIASIAAVAGFFIMLFTYLGVSMLMKSSHSF